jgi:hypothetical protein
MNDLSRRRRRSRARRGCGVTAGFFETLWVVALLDDPLVCEISRSRVHQILDLLGWRSRPRASR